jgi:hypothetical protein
MKRVRLLKEQDRNKLLENSGISLVQNANLISVDIQPEYSDHLGFDLYSFTSFLNQNIDSMNSLTFLYNGAETLGMVGENEYKFWLYENGLEEQNLNVARFYDKGYAFFRYCMDEGADEDEIVKLVKYMIQNNINDSRDIDEEMWGGFMQAYGYESSQVRDLLEPAQDAINIPDLMDFLQKYSGKIVICGGGINECFKEVEIALNALGKNYNVLTKFTY